MTSSRASYLAEVREAMGQALCLLEYPSPHVEGHNKPLIEVEAAGHPLIAAPIVVSRGPQEECLVEHSINSSRISFTFKTVDGLDRFVIDTNLRFLMQRAEELGIVRRVPVTGYDLTFLITHSHVTHLQPELLCDFLLQFLEEFGMEVKAAKLMLRTQARTVVDGFWASVADMQPRSVLG